MSVRGVNNTIQRVTADGVMNKQDVQEVLQEAGEKVSEGEENAIREALNANTFEVAPDAAQYAGEKLQNISQVRGAIARNESTVEARATVLAAEEAAVRQLGVETSSYGGSKIPEAVKEIVNKAVEAGATAYDVFEPEGNPEQDEKDPTKYTMVGKWSPYPQDMQPLGNLEFDYTELTPAKIKEDMETEQTFNVLTGYRTESNTDMRTGQSRDIRIAEYEEVTMKGSGNITALYDEAQHPDTFARARGGQKFASNFAILSDGSFHALPAARRNDGKGNPRLILTNPSLARGKRMLFNGHIQMQGGVVTGIGMSGRLHKMAAKGDAKFVNPLPLLEAWGFEISPNLRLRFEGRWDTPNVDANTHVIGNEPDNN